MKVVLSTVLDFESLEDLAAACADCIENSDLTSLDNGVPEDWDLPEVWNEEVVKDFLKFNGLYLLDVKELIWRQIFLTIILVKQE